MTRRPIPPDSHHSCQPRTLLLLVPRRAFRGDTRRGFPPRPAIVLGVTRALPDTLREQAIDLIISERHCSRAAAFKLLAQFMRDRPDAAEAVARERAQSDQGTISKGRGYPPTLEIR